MDTINLNSFNADITLMEDLLQATNKGLNTLNTPLIASTISKGVFRPFISDITNYSNSYKLFFKLIPKIMALEFAPDPLYIGYYPHFEYYPLPIRLDLESRLISRKTFIFSSFLTILFIFHVPAQLPPASFVAQVLAQAPPTPFTPQVLAYPPLISNLSSVILSLIELSLSLFLSYCQPLNEHTISLSGIDNSTDATTGISDNQKSKG